MTPSQQTKHDEVKLPPLPKPIEIEWPQLNSVALGCGVEDRGIHERYEAAEYGFQDGVDKAAESVPEQIFDADQMREYALAAIAQLCAKPDSAEQVPVAYCAVNDKDGIQWGNGWEFSAIQRKDTPMALYAALLNIAQQAPTVVSELLREYAANPGYSHNDYADSMISGAEEIERVYGKVQHLQSQLSASQEENARLKEVIRIVRLYPDFDSGEGPLVEMMDSALNGDSPKLLYVIGRLSQGLKP